MMTSVPFAFFAVFGLDRLLDALNKFPPFSMISVNKAASIVLIVTCLWIVPQYLYKRYVDPIRDQTSVTPDDMAGFQWLKQNAEPKDLVQTNYGDGGQWISAITGLRGTGTHVNVLYLDKVRPDSTLPSYVFIGSKCVYKDACGHKASDYLTDKTYEKVFQSGDSYIFRKRQKH